MKPFILAPVFALVILTASAQQTSAAKIEPIPDACPMVHRPATPFIPSPPLTEVAAELGPSRFLIGTDELFTIIDDPMVWEWHPHPRGYELYLWPMTVKWFWLRVGYDPKTEPYPKIKVTGRRLDGPALPLVNDRPTNALSPKEEEGGEMVTGMYVPTPGCWEVTGEYKGNKVSFVVWVAPLKSSQ